MISELSIIQSDTYNPYKNLAVEKYLTSNVGSEQFILFLWQNEKTIVIGKNQNCFGECNTQSLKNDGCFLARRLSGGGAVYHDIGNLNFSFITSKSNYNIINQLNIIIQALKKFGIEAERSGRNDITVNGKKISGNAFILSGNSCCHHGTLMVDVDINRLEKYLIVSKEKLNSNGVNSVHSRVANLIDFNKLINIDSLKKAIVESARSMFGVKCSDIVFNDSDRRIISQNEDFFASEEWIFNKNQNTDFLISHRFSWGDFSVAFILNKNIISDSKIYTDCLNPDIFTNVQHLLKGKEFSSDSLSSIFDNCKNSCKNSSFEDFTLDSRSIYSDISEYIKSLQI